MSIPGADEPVLEDENVALIVEALDSHEYWQLNDPPWRRSGAVILPGDNPQRWAERSALSGREREAIAEIERCRSLAERLRRRRS